MSGTNWAMGIEACARALTTNDDTADCYYREAIDLFTRTGSGMELARTRLLYGEWLRRVNRRKDARENLRAALRCSSKWVHRHSLNARIVNCWLRERQYVSVR